MDKQRGISVVLEGDGDLKGDIKKSGIEGCEEDSVSYVIYLNQAEYFISKGLTRKALDRLNIALRLEPESTGLNLLGLRCVSISCNM